MKVSIDLTENKGQKEGIPIYMKNIITNCKKNEFCGGAFAGIRHSVKKLEKRLTDFYGLSKTKVKKYYIPDRFFPRLKYFKLNFPYKKIFDKDTDLYLCFNNFMPRNKLKCKKVVVIHDLTPLYSNITSNFKKKLFVRAYKYTIENADRIITVSEFSKSDIIKTFPEAKGKVEVVYNGVDCSRFQVRVDEKRLAEIKAKYELPANYVLFVGQARENKNLLRLLRAYSALPQSIKEEYGLVYANTNPEINTLLKQLSEKNVRLLNGIDAEDLVGVYQGASLFTLVSTNEGFGIPIIEAMAAEVPVVCSNISSLPEVAGEAAITVDPYSEEDITKAIYKVLSDEKLQKELVKKGLERIKVFNWKDSAEKFEKILDDVMGDRK